MRLHISILAVFTLFIGACKVSTKPKAPTIKPIEIQLPTFKISELPKEFFVCDQPETNISEELKKTAIEVKGVTNVQDRERTDCNGKKTLEPKASLHDFNSNLTITPPEEIRSKVTMADIENKRTCASRRLQVDSKETKDPSLTPTAQWAISPYWIDSDGHITIGVNDTTFVLNSGLNVLPGQNLMSVIYYGRCLGKRNEAGVCDKAEELVRKQVLVNVILEKQELNGVRQWDTCYKSKTK
ncbi:MAG: hypothetical protein AB7G93_05350 [Bdellovibrionales bacterium]